MDSKLPEGSRVITMSLTSKLRSALQTPSPNRLEVLDWLRALAIIVVVLGHSNRPMAPGGAVGVSIFFALSGYLIASILLRDGIFTPRNLGVFLLRRVTRIYPMYLVSIASVCLFYYLTSIETLDKIFPNLFGILSFTGEPAGWVGYGFGVLWTLAVEFWFYLTFPLLLLVGIICRRILLVLSIATLFSIAAKLFQFGNHVLLYYDHFLIGALVFAAFKANSIPKWLQGQWILLAGTVLIAFAVIFPYPGARNLLWYTQSAFAAIGTALIILYSHLFQVRLTIPVLAFIGRISYSVYLMHAVLLDVFPRFPSNIPVYLIAVVLVSTFTYYFIEQPVIRWVHQRFNFSDNGLASKAIAS